MPKRKLRLEQDAARCPPGSVTGQLSPNARLFSSLYSPTLNGLLIRLYFRTRESRHAKPQQDIPWIRVDRPRADRGISCGRPPGRERPNGARTNRGRSAGFPGYAHAAGGGPHRDPGRNGDRKLRGVRRLGAREERAVLGMGCVPGHQPGAPDDPETFTRADPRAVGLTLAGQPASKLGKYSRPTRRRCRLRDRRAPVQPPCGQSAHGRARPCCRGCRPCLAEPAATLRLPLLRVGKTPDAKTSRPGGSRDFRAGEAGKNSPARSGFSGSLPAVRSPAARGFLQVRKKFLPVVRGVVCLRVEPLKIRRPPFWPPRRKIFRIWPGGRY